MKKIFKVVMLALVLTCGMVVLESVPAVKTEAYAAKKSGFYSETSTWNYYENGSLCKTAKVVKATISGYGTGWWYVKDGKLTIATGVVSTSTGRFYIKNGKVDFSYSGNYTLSNGNIYKVVNGKVDTSCTKAVKEDGVWRYYVKGFWQKTLTGFYDNGKNRLRVENGIVNFSYEAFVKDGSYWRYYKGGKFQSTYSGFQKNNYGWWYLEKGTVAYKNCSKYGTLGTWTGTWLVKSGKVKGVSLSVGSSVRYMGQWQGYSLNWTVIAQNDAKYLVVADKGIEYTKYNAATKTTTSWATSDIRTWLNGEFYEDSDLSETANAEHIMTTTVKTKGSSTTKDKLFLLSSSEVNSYLKSSQKKCYASTYAQSQKSGSYCNWWLRDTGKNGYMAQYVGTNGKTSSTGALVYKDSCAVRPAMWVDYSIETFSDID